MLRLGAGLLLLAVTSVAGAQTTLRIATLAPEGSSWMQLFHTFARQIAQQSKGQLTLKFQAGATAGDERQVVHKMKLGALDGAAVTPIGLSLIQSEVLLFEVPMLVTRADELNHLRTRLDADLHRMFLDKGYVLLAWGDVGPVHLFSSRPITSRADLDKLKFWAWVDDPVVRAVFAELGLPGVPLSLPDVLPSLAKGLINGCYGSPLSILALGWHAHVKYMISVPITQAIGAAVVTRRVFDKLAPPLQTLLLERARELETQVNAQISADNVKALASLQKSGLKVMDAPPEVLRDFEAAALRARNKLEGSVYSKEFRARVESMLEAYRAGKTP